MVYVFALRALFFDDANLFEGRRNPVERRTEVLVGEYGVLFVQNRHRVEFVDTIAYRPLVTSVERQTRVLQYGCKGGVRLIQMSPS
jgi:hypothetical protein